MQNYYIQENDSTNDANARKKYFGKMWKNIFGNLFWFADGSKPSCLMQSMDLNPISYSTLKYK